MKILVTGAAGFIGFFVVKALATKGHEVFGLDNINEYYDQDLKLARLNQLGIRSDKAVLFNEVTSSDSLPSFKFTRLDLADRTNIPELFKRERFQVVCNLAAQAGVRYSLENPEAYVDSNIAGFLNVLEACRHFKVDHLVYASSSSVYGLNKDIPFSTSHNVDHPISLYAATKKSNELMAHTYSHLFNLRTTGLRFFTVYGPWGRPDMAMFLFTKAIIENKSIKVFNEGRMERDFTYIDDVVEGVIRIIEDRYSSHYEIEKKYKLYNIGNHFPVNLMDFIGAIERELGKKAKKKFMSMQPGDVEKTWANVDSLMQDYNYSPATTIEDGVSAFINWYKSFYKVST